MKILQFIHGLDTGGAETLVKDYMLNFDKQKNNVVLLCFHHAKNSPYEKILADAGIKVVYASDYLHYGKILNKICRYLFVRKFIRMESPDILHAHLTTNRYIKFSKLDKKTKIFYTVHNEPDALWNNNDRKRKKDFEAAKWLLRHYDYRFIVLHDKMREEINDIFGVKDTIILNNGIDLFKYKEMIGKNSMRDALGVPKDAFVVGHTGRFVYQKKHDFLVDSFKKIKDVKKNAFLLMVGSGDEKNKIEIKLCNYGFDNDYLILSNRDDVPSILNAMDVFVFPSLYEGLPLSLIEAQEAGLPCFASNTISDYATISNLVTRLPLDIGPKKWAETILNYKKPEKIILNDEDWDIKKITKRLENIYEEALKGKKNGKK